MSPEQNPAVIAHYRITGKLGEGEMGEVWRATDTKLNRSVAIKVLPESFAADPDRLARFTRESQLLASLNHPNIAAIYGVEERALVMELVEGATLDERIAQGPMPVEEILPILNQLVEALEYAHEKRVIHRDLKPANIKLTPDGKIKVLDFGLAKALAADVAPNDPISSPTLTMRATMAGTIMGTAAYMAPEQARGHNVDQRADIWAFGVVIYELAAGARLFDGPSISDTLASVLKEEPGWDRIPPKLRPLLRRCLAKDPRQRLRDIGDARLLLEPRPEPAALEPRRKPSVLPWMAAAVMATLAAMALWAPWRGQHAADPNLLNLDVDLGPEARLVQAGVAPFTLSPDGKRLLFNSSGATGQTRLSMRRLGQAKANVLPGTAGLSLWIYEISRDTLSRLTRGEVAPSVPVWSPDGKHIAYQAGGTGGGHLAWIRTDGAGQEEKLSSKNIVQSPSSFTPDGRRMLFHESTPAGSIEIWSMPLPMEGSAVRPGQAEPLVPGGLGGRMATVSPDGRWLAYVEPGSANAEIFVRPLTASASGSRWQVSNGGGYWPMWSGAAHELFYETAGAIWVVPYTVKGDSFVANRARVWGRLPAGTGVGGFDLAPDGKRLVVAAPAEAAAAGNEQTHVTFLVNFFDELRKKVPTK
jgi:serine/threonine protein kinase